MIFRAFLLVFFVAPVYAGSATFTWQKPIPAFNATPPAGWVIDEYRIYCVIVNSGQPDIIYNQVIQGYDIEIASYNDIPAGEMSCYLTAWSAADGGAGRESSPSDTVIKTITEINQQLPQAPTLFDFIPAVSSLINPTNGDMITDVTYRMARGVSHKVSCITTTANNELTSVCVNKSN